MHVSLSIIKGFGVGGFEQTMTKRQRNGARVDIAEAIHYGSLDRRT